MRATTAVVPRPQVVRPGQGRFVLDVDTVLVGDPGPVRAAIEDLVREAELQALGQGPPKDSAIELRVDPNEKGLGDEGYRLSITPKRVLATASGAAGLHWALVTFRQLLSRRGPGGVISAPCLEIQDRPRFPWRGAMLDVCRHFMPKDFVLKFIDLLSLHKLNRFQWHLTDDQGWRLEVRRYPLLTEVGAWRKQTLVGRARDAGSDPVFDGQRHGGFYSQEDVREVVRYAAARYITVVPEIEMPGHASAALAAYPELGNTGERLEVPGHWGIHEHAFNVDEKTIDFLRNVLDEAMDLFPGPYIHIGGDECLKKEWETSPAAQARMKELGLRDADELQSWFVRRMDSHLTAKGRRLVGWDEILEGGLAQGATVMSWRGEEGGIAAAGAGHDVVMAPMQTTYLDGYQSPNRAREPLAFGRYLPLRKVYAYEPVPAKLDPKHKHRVLGTQAQLWTEYIPTPEQCEYMAYPRLCALAEVAWLDAAHKDYRSFRRRLAVHLGRLDRLGVGYRKLSGR